MRSIVLATLMLVGLGTLDRPDLQGQTANGSGLSSLAALEAARPATAAMGARPTWKARVLTAVGGGMLGAGAGFFTSQVLTGDWDPEKQDIDRRTWAAIGGSIGFGVGLSFPIGGRPGTPQPPRALPGGRFMISGVELRRAGAATAFDAVRLLRPQWLEERGFDIIGEAPAGRIDVYLDDSRLGGVNTLREVSAQNVRSIHFLDASAATFRWGAGHTHGAILVISEGN